MDTDAITIRLAKWPQEQTLLRQLRDRVFVREQQVPVEIEWDNQDGDARHFIAFDTDNRPIATARLLPSGQLGRMAVLPEWRNRGIGTQVLRYILQWAETTQIKLFLHAQVRAVPFYQRAGFVPEGEQFVEAGLLHQTMRLKESE